MRVLVCGGRDYGFRLDTTGKKQHNQEHWECLYGELDKYIPDFTCLIAGGATGADQMAERWARDRQLPYLIFPAQWYKYEKKAGYLRNKQMLDEGKPDLVIAFPGGKGTAMMVKLAEEAGVEVIKIEH